ncbi:MAG: penicillin-binding protein activator [Marinomonas sp.]
MKRILFNRRMVLVAGTAAFLAGCQVVPKTGPSTSQAPQPRPSATTLPTDQTRHRIALLVPMTGGNGAVGQALANAANMALLDTNASNLRITTYDTSTNPGAAAAKAVADGNRLILGPLMAQNIPAIAPVAANADVPIISFSNDSTAAGKNVFVMGHVPEQSIDRSIAYARSQGAVRFGALVPNGQYGNRSMTALSSALRQHGGALTATERYARGNTNISNAATRLKARGGFDTVVIADGARLATRAAAEIKTGSSVGTRVIGTELWGGEGSLTQSSAMRGAIFSAVSDGRFKRYSDSYDKRFGRKPFRISSLGYDSVLLTLRVARDWKTGRKFPTKQLREEKGFVGVDGAFRFRKNGVIERALAVVEVRNGSFATVDQAPASFSK